MPKHTLHVNGAVHTVDVPSDVPLLWILRDHLDLRGTKFGCGIGRCGACTVHVAGRAVRSCLVPVGNVGSDPITTIEALGDTVGSAVKNAWLTEQVPQCGYCQPGFVMAVAALLSESPAPTDAEIDREITNLCRCGTQSRIRRAIHRAARG